MSMETDQEGLQADEKEEEESSSKKQKITQIEQPEIFVDKVKSTIPLQHTNHKAQSTADKSKQETDGKMPLFVNEWQMGEKGAFLGTEKVKGFSSNKHEFQEKEPFICMESCSKETPCLMCNVHSGIESSNKAKISLIGVRRQKNGRYGVVITDQIRHKQVWLGTFDTVEEASQAYLSKKSEFEKFRQQGDKDNTLKENLDQIQQIESPIVTSLSMGNDQTLGTASVSKINLHETTHVVEVQKKNWSGKEPESAKETTCLIANVHGIESYDECNTKTSYNPKPKRSLLGVRKQTTGRYGAVITDQIRHKQVWLGTFDTVEEASQAYFSKKSEFEKLRQQGNKDNKPKENCDQIQQPESPVVLSSLSVANDQTLDASSVGCRNRRIDSHETTPHIVEVHKNKMSGEVPESFKQTPCLMASVVHNTESSDECNISTSNLKAKISLLGVRRQKNGRYGAVITDTTRHKQVWLGTFGTVEEASQAYFSKKFELENEKLNQQHNKENKPKKNCDQIQQPESPVVQTSVSVADVQTSGTASVGMRNERNVFHGTTHVVGVHKSKTSEKEPEFSKETSCLMDSVHATESSDQCNTSARNSTAKISLIGVRRQKNGRYGAVITDTTKHKQAWLGTFDTVEEASQAYFSKKFELENEKLNQQHNKENKPKKNCDQIQQPESPVVQASLSVADVQTLGTASVGMRNERNVFHGTTHVVGVHKSKTSEKEPEFSKETSCLMDSVHATESSDQCNTSTSNSTAKISLIGVRRQKNGRYGAVITDTTKHKQAWLGTFDTVEEASQAYFSKKFELENEKLNQQHNKENKPKKNCDQIQQPESPVVQASLSVADVQTLGTASVGIRNERNVFHGTTHVVGIHKSKTSEKEPEFSKETSCLMDSVHATESSDQCNTSTSDSTAKISLVGVRRQKNGRYGAVITDTTRHKKVWLGTFDTVEEASQAYFSKKSELENEKLNQQGNKETRDQIQQPESLVASLSMDNDQTFNAASGGRRNKRIDSHKATPDIVGVHKNKTSGKEFESSRETARLMDNIHGTESCDECNTTTSCDPKAKISLIGIRRQKKGRYGAVITDRIKHKRVWLGTFDTVEEASQAYLFKKPELKRLGHQRNKENKPKDRDQVQQLESLVVPSLSVADQTLNTTRVRRRNERIDSHKTITRFFRVHKRKDSGKYTSEIRNPISKKRIWLGTFGSAEEASQAYQSKKLEFERLVHAKRQCGNEQTHSKQDEKSEKLVNVESGHENVNRELKSAGGSEINVTISNSSNGGTEERIDSHEIGTAEEVFHAYQSKKFDLQNSKEVELQSNMPTDSSAGEKQEGQEDDEDLQMGEWVQLPGNRAVKFSLKLGLPIIDNYGSLLGEFSTLDDLSICKTDHDNET
ncbi:hypothetical protein RDI58_021174 [Solanum bulbocastanum]|uniref:AP2/ERF domain-containing protein n=1 Tax=Solanum bulbocastanum TaxID=147425 RepID=A0AAN8TDU5_SOLBU